MPGIASTGDPKTLHFGDLCQLVIDAGLADTMDAEEWLVKRGVCAPAIAQYAGAMIDAAEESGHPLRTELEGIFTTGLTLGIAIGEAQQPPRSASGRAIDRLVEKERG